MKYRTDFVTNSSSESFFTVRTYSDSGHEKGFFGDDGWSFSKWEKVGQGKDGIYINKSTIRNKEELCAILLFGNYTDYEDLTFEALSAFFLLLIGEISCPELINRIQMLADSLDVTSYSYDVEITYGESYDFSVLQTIDTDSDNKEEIISRIMGIFEIDYLEIDEERLAEVLNFYRDKEMPFEKTSLLEVIEVDAERDDIINVFTDPLERSHKKDEFPQMTEDDPLFEKECNRWTGHVKDLFGKEGLYSYYTEEALSEGDYSGLVGRSNVHDIYEYFYPNGISKCLDSFCCSGEIPDRQFEEAENSYPKLFGESLIIPSQIKRIGRYAFKGSRLTAVILQDGINEIGAFAFDGTDCRFSQIPSSVNRIGVTLVYDLLEYAVNNKILYTEEKDLFRLLDCELNQNEMDSDDNSGKYCPKALKLLAENGYIPKSFKEYPITDLLEIALEINANEYLDLLLGSGLELDYKDVAHYIYNDTLETIYPLFDRGLKIEASAFDNLITYASECGKPEYTAWLLNRKNEDAQEKDVIE